MKIKLWFLLIVGLLLTPTGAVFAQGNAVPGYWKTFDGDGKLRSIVKLWVHQGKMVGRIVKTFPYPGENPNRKCDQCSGTLKDKPIRGMTFLWGFKPDGNNPQKWIDGEIVDPENGKQYHCQLTLVDGGKKLEAFGYIRLLFKIGRTEVWVRGSEKDLSR